MKSVQDIIDDLNRDSAPIAANEKTAAVGSSAVDTARTELQASLSTLLSGDHSKQASESGAASVDQIEKIASDLAAADDVATIKEARLYGAGVFDGFIARANQYATRGGEEKTSSVKLAAQTKVAAQAGYAAMDEKLTKIAATDQNHMVKQAAADGFAAMNQKLGEFRGGEKTAAERQTEYNQGVLEGLDKVAEFSIDCFERGFEHMGALAQNLAG